MNLYASLIVRKYHRYFSAGPLTHHPKPNTPPNTANAQNTPNLTTPPHPELTSWLVAAHRVFKGYQFLGDPYSHGMWGPRLTYMSGGYIRGVELLRNTYKC